MVLVRASCAHACFMSMSPVVVFMFCAIMKRGPQTSQFMSVLVLTTPGGGSPFSASPAGPREFGSAIWIDTRVGSAETPNWLPLFEWVLTLTRLDTIVGSAETFSMLSNSKCELAPSGC